MKGAPRRQGGGGLRGLAVGTALAALLLVGQPVTSHAQPAGTTFGDAFALPSIPADEKMLVESDQLVYDYDNGTVAAVGNVRIYYAQYTLQASKVQYDQRSGRLIASGNVRLVDPSGNQYTTDHIDITDDFRDGFVQSLRVETVDRTYFTAASGERSGGETTTFNQGSYTACEPCKDNPTKPLLWNVKATKIVINHKEQMVYFTDARIEFFGLPVAYLPYFAIPDPSVKRKSGWLVPSVGYSSRVGLSASTPYYWALAPNYDVTFTPTVYSKQGLLTDVEWRHRLENGSYTIRGAGIYQLNPGEFAGQPGDRTFRGGLRTTGEFYLNKDWTFGWDGTLSTDRAFTNDYGVLNEDSSETISTVHLTGIGDRNYFEARASYFQVLTDPALAPSGNPGLYDQNRQGWVAPVIDYHKVVDGPLNGEFSFTTNVQNVVRAEDDPFWVGNPPDPDPFFHGTAGTTVRATQEAAWQGRYVTPMGQVIVPFASVRGDAFFMNGQSALAVSNGLTSDPTAFRFMPTVGVEASWPVLVTAPGATHIIEPIAQLLVRPNEMSGGVLPNNDAQSLVFDTSNLFDRDKFSGYDRVEGGTRANLGVRYAGTFDNGATIDGTFGQSIHLAGINPFAVDTVSNVGAYSGLETTFSDYVAGVSLDSGVGPRLSARGRFDESTFNLNRAELQATTAVGPLTASASYLYLRSDPNSGLTSPASVVRGAASVNFVENWRAFGTVTYDIAKSSLASNSIGLAFDNECLTLSIAYSETLVGTPEKRLNMRLQLRTFGETSYSSNLSKLTN